MSHNHRVPRPDLYRAVTDSIVAAIEAGAGAFVMPWHRQGAAIAKPENALTRMEYHGVNVLLLWAAAMTADYESGTWASYKQWQKLGAQVREGERGTLILFYKRLDRADVSPDADHDGQRAPLVARASRVFNAGQVAGWQPPPPRIFGDPVSVLASVKAFVEGSRAVIIHGGASAFYHIARDVITLPEPDRFVGSPTSSPSEAYAATLLHELVHWSGAKHRLARPLGQGSREELAREELVAEIGAAFLCADLGVSNVPRPDHAAYVADWLTILRGDTKAIVAASRLAGFAANYLHDLAARPS